MRYLFGKSPEEPLEVRNQILGFLCEVGLIELVNQLILLAELSVYVSIFEY